MPGKNSPEEPAIFKFMPYCQYCRKKIFDEDLEDCIRYTTPYKKGIAHKPRYYFICKECAAGKFSTGEIFAIAFGVLTLLLLLTLVLTLVYHLANTL